MQATDAYHHTSAAINTAVAHLEAAQGWLLSLPQADAQDPRLPSQAADEVERLSTMIDDLRQLAFYTENMAERLLSGSEGA